MSASIDELFGELRSLLNRSPRDYAWARELEDLIGRAHETGDGSFQQRWGAYLDGFASHWPAPFCRLSSVENLARFGAMMPSATFDLFLRAGNQAPDFQRLATLEALALARV